MLRTSCLKRILIFAIEIIILGVFVAVCRVAAAEPADITLNISQGSIVIGENDITYGGNPYLGSYIKGQPITIIGSTTTNTVTVESGVPANITLENVNIDVSASDNKAAFEIEKDSIGNVNITLVGDNKLKSGKNCAGLQKNGDSDNVGKLTIQGTGSLTATGGNKGAGIGGGNENSASNITINGVTDGGKVTAKGGTWAAGIGGGGYGDGSVIIINNSEVNATSNGSGAGIGGGKRSNSGKGGKGSDIEISGKSKVTAESNSFGAGIGGGAEGGEGKNNNH